eukprot:CAMPEP_0118851092 /NCGR_PEP_ID=MMETSP1163-20130328/664_1 /TAXON_ID=124430 /ORGANISM="Phaeomonas parva, Strain CCMP2877" /LENGTH=36 /DNA_ID= /DNA_START= /DNA_END= /DNA_ORIENTATION=
MKHAGPLAAGGCAGPQRPVEPVEGVFAPPSLGWCVP